MALAFLIPRAAAGATAAGGQYHSLVVKSDGTVWAWGYNGYGQLGDGTYTQAFTVVQVSGLTGVTAVSAGANHSLALRSDGTVWAWGYNGYGALGNGNNTSSNTPVQVSGLTSVSAIAAGDNHSVAMKSDGTVWTWGYNGNGQLGDGGVNARNTPYQVTGISAIAIGGGDSHTLVVLAGGAMKSWGNNNNGQLGDGTQTEAHNPVSVSSVSTMSLTVGGALFSRALKSDGTVWGWGYNGFAQLGDNTVATPRLTAVQTVGLTSVSAVAAGIYHGLALKGDGTVWGWGYNPYGAVGDGATTQRNAPVQVTGLTAISSIAAGQYHSVAVASDGSVWTWGYNAQGQLGDGTTANQPAPVRVADPGFAWKVGKPTFSPPAGTYNSNQSVAISCATPGSTIRYTTDGTDPTSSSPVYSAALSITQSTTLKAKASKAGFSDSDVTTAVYTLKVATPTFSPGGGTYTTAQTVTISDATPGVTIRYTTDGSDPTTLSAPYSGPVLLSTGTTLKAKGFQSGWADSDTATATYTYNFGTLAAPTMSPGAGTYADSVDVTLSAAPYATIRYTTNGSDPTASSTVYTTPIGLNVTTTLKAKAFHPDYTTSVTTTNVYTIQPATPAFSLAAGSYPAGQTVTITDATADATIYYTINGNDPTTSDSLIASGGAITLGNFTLKARAFKTGCVPSDVQSAAYTVTGQFTSATVVGGNFHTLALLPDGTVWAWGANAQGQVGDGTGTQKTLPTPVSGLTGIISVAAGSDHSLALKSDGTVWAWGYNPYGALGDNTTTTRLAPIQIAGLTGVTALAAGQFHSLAVTGGTVWAWGYNGNGQLGDNTTTQRLTPVQVSGLTGVVAVGAGWNHSLALKSDGTVWAWGYNGNGQLGDSTTTPRLTPVQVSGLSATGIGGGANVSFALKADGTAWAWGYNGTYQLGDGTNTERHTPVQVSLTGVVSRISAGYYHAIALKTDGTVWTWGDNRWGQLGDGTTTPRTTPAQVAGMASASAISAGYWHSLALTSDGTIWAWGHNGSGQLGDGTTYPRSSPVKVSEPGFAWKVGTPTRSVDPDYFLPYTYVLNVVVATVTPGATITYTTNGIDPTLGDAQVVSGGTVVVDQSLTLKAKGWKTGLQPSNVQTSIYTLKVATPTLSPGGGTYNTPQNVTIACSVSGATIRYTTDGSDPTTSSSTYSAPVAITATTTLKAKAWKTAWTDSDIVSATYTMKGGTPTFTPGTGAYSGAQTVTVATVTPGATIHYTTSGLDPTASDPTVASGGTITVSQSLTLKASVWAPGWTTSDVAVGSYSIGLGTVATPTMTPAPGTFTGTQSVTLAITTSGALIRYTLDGTAPGPTSPIYTAPIALTDTTTITAIAYKPDWLPSATATGTYTLTTSAVATPTIQPGTGTYPDHQVVTIACATAGATIRYTTTGADPTTSDATISSGGTILVDRSLTLKAKAWNTGMTDSAVRRADYVLVGAVVAGQAHTLVLKGDGTVWAWGVNTDGEIGDGTTTQRLTPVQVSGLSGVVAISAASHSLAVKADGTVWAWGWNGGGQVGDGTTNPRLTPFQVPGLTNVVGVAAGIWHSLAVKADGTVWAWGMNGNGELGDGTTTQRFSPVQVLALTGVTRVSAGYGFSMALKTDGATSGSVWTWGYDLYNQLGDGSNTSRSTPVRILSDAIAISAGHSYHGLAVKSDGTTWGWGYNLSGQVGDGTNSQRSTPVQVVGFSGARAVAGGNSHSLALTNSGVVWAWGSNGNGMLGDGTITGTVTPLWVFGVQNVVGISAGDSHSVALDLDGSVWTWGYNGNGQLGDGTILQKLTPVKVLQAVDDTWLDADPDQDGLTNRREFLYGCDPMNPDTNGDGLPDGAAIAAGLSCSNPDMDGDGLPNAVERQIGTDPFKADTDGDGVPDGTDCFPLDPTRWQCPAPDPNDHTPPVITLTEPTNATLVGTVPP